MKDILRHVLTLALGSALFAAPGLAIPQSQDPSQDPKTHLPPAADAATERYPAGSAERHRKSKEFQGRRRGHRQSRRRQRRELLLAGARNRPGQAVGPGSRAFLEAN